MHDGMVGVYLGAFIGRDPPRPLPNFPHLDAKNDNVVRLTLPPSLPPIPRHMDLPFLASRHLPRLIVMHLDESNGGITQNPIDLDVSVLPIVL